MPYRKLTPDLAQVEQPFVCEAPNDMAKPESRVDNIKYLVVGILFGIVFVSYRSRSARVDFPWSIWATIEKLRM